MYDEEQREQEQLDEVKEVEEKPGDEPEGVAQDQDQENEA